MADRVLLTGISGFLGGHVALALLNAGYAVRGSVRHLDKSAKVAASLKNAGADISRLEFTALNLLDDRNWPEAAGDCRYLQHIASPLVVKTPKDRDELIRPAVEGTRRAIMAAMAAGVERIVLTSSIAAIQYGHAGRTRPLTESDWTDLGAKGVSAYAESKTRAEREAWALMDAAGRRADLAVVNPGIILGPLLDEDPGTSVVLVQRLLDGTIPAAPRIDIGIVDARDVAALHLAAMTAPGAGGHRFIAVEASVSFMDLANILRENFPDCAGKLPRFEVPEWLVRLAGLFDATIKGNTAELGTHKRFDATPAKTLLGRDFIPFSQAAIATARSLIAHHLI
jgi:dihydroflavonol-4-reductase